MAFNIKNAISKAAKQTDMNVAQKGGGGGYTPPEEGKPGLRFVSYVELGPQNETYQGKPRVREQVKMTFELHGKKWPLNDAGQPHRISITLSKSLNEKATFYKLFKQMNWSGKHKHMAEMLGEDFSGQVFHKTVGEGAEAKVYANLKDPASGVFAISAPFAVNEDGEDVRRNIPPAVGDLRCFLWDYPDADQWASIFIEGEYDDGKSKNVFQNAIKASPAFEGSPIEALLMGATGDDDADDVEKAKAEAKAKKESKPAAAPKKKAAEKKPQPKQEPTEAPDDDDPLADVSDE